MSHTVKQVKEVIGFIFSFDELNTNVFYNAILANFKNRNQIHTVAYVPKEFSCLFFDFDEVIEIPDKYFGNVLYGTKYSDNIAPDWIEKSIQFRHRVVLKLIKQIPLLRKFVANHPSLLATYRQLTPLYRSGLFSWARRDYNKRFSKPKNKLTVVSNFLIPNQKKISFEAFPDLNVAYQYLFDQLFISISNGLVLTSAKPYMQGGGIAVRTRNFKNKATAHNSDLDQTSSIVHQILQSGSVVTNYGAPPLSLFNLKDEERYSEIYLPSINDELYSISNKVVLRADAGLFVLYACSNLQLCTITPEWSDFLGISLMEARAKRDGPQNGDLEFPKFRNESEFNNWLNQ